MKKSEYPVSFIICVLLLTLPACKYSTEYKLVKGGDKFTMMVPPWVKEVNDLKPGAEFQYVNRFRNFYAIGETLSKDSTKSVSSVMSANLGILSKSMVKPVINDSTTITIGGLPGARVEISGKMTGEDIYFSEVVLEGKSRFYHLSIWTRNADRKLKFKDDIDHILNSFKEL
jgi:hypothetical protein